MPALQGKLQQDIYMFRQIATRETKVINGAAETGS